MKFFFRVVVIFISVFPSYLIADVVVDKLVVRFATEANYYPFEYLGDLGELQGFDIDIAKAICVAEELDCSFDNQSFESLLLTLAFGRFDAIIAALDITQERQSTVDFSNSYYKVAPVFVSLSGSADSFTLAGKFIAVQANSSNQNYLIDHANKESFVIPYLTLTTALSDLKAGEIDAVFADQAVIFNFLEKSDNRHLFSIRRSEEKFVDLFSDGYGIAVKKGNVKLKKRLDQGLKKIQANGVYLEIFKRYFNQ